MADLEFFFDPVCPWAWITSRWVEEVRSHRPYDVRWRFISLKILNSANDAEWYTPQYRRMHEVGHETLRIAAHLDATVGNDAVGRFYAAVGTEGHTKGRRADFVGRNEEFLAECLGTAGLDPSLAAVAQNGSLDARIAGDTELALSRTGRDVGTPILTFHPGAADEGSFFGPVIARIPRGAEALRLWDAVEVVATTPGVAELKRTLRNQPDFS